MSDMHSQGVHSTGSRSHSTNSSGGSGSRSGNHRGSQPVPPPIYEEEEEVPSSNHEESYSIEDDGEEGEEYTAAGEEDADGDAPSTMGDSHASFMNGNNRNDPNYLFGLLQDALPKQTEIAVTDQQRRDQAEVVWDRVRRWLWANPHPHQRQAAADVRGVGDVTCLHMVCKLHNPPEDVVQALVEAAQDTVPWTDSHGWLPLHHACANGASPEVLKILVDAYPAGKVTQDKQNRTPLHFYATRNSDNPAAMAINAELLSDTGAAALTDRSGMLPIHYACAYGTHPVVLKVLGKAFPASLVAKENNGRTPMHLAMVNAHRDESPNVIRFLLDHPDSHGTINTRDHDGYLPLHLLALGLKGYRADDSDKRTNVSECLTMYLSAEPKAAADFLTAIQDLPDWLQDTAVVSKHVRNVLNEKIVQRFPTSILMLDGMFLVVLIVCFAFTTRNHIDMRFDPDNYEDTTSGSLVMVFVGASYFLIRELVQFASLMSLGSLSSWWTDPANYLDISVIVLVFYYGILMLNPDSGLTNTTFRSGAAFTQGTLWVAIIVYLKSTLVDFAVFVGGVFYVVQRLVAFLIAVGVILLAFAQMFYFVYLDTSLCSPDPSYEFDPICSFPHCTFENSLLKVYTMMMGQINDVSRYSTNLTAQILFVGYAFLVVILLSNVLIAIVTDSYEIIQNDRAAIVFWSNRLDFVAEMDAITYAIQRRIYGKKTFAVEAENDKKKNLTNSEAAQAQSQALEGAVQEEYQPSAGGAAQLSPLGETPESADVTQEASGYDFDESTEYFREAWHQVMLLFDAHLYEDIDWIETWVYNIFRIFSIFCVIPLWLAVGAITAGWLWPPQIREYLFAQKETTISRAELERQKLGQLKSIGTELKALKQELMREMANDRDEMIRMKAEVETVQGEVYDDLQQVKELMGSLLSA